MLFAGAGVGKGGPLAAQYIAKYGVGGIASRLVAGTSLVAGIALIVWGIYEWGKEC